MDKQFKKVNVATVEENAMSYSKREADDAKPAREFYADKRLI
jgi:hypothetical protein